MSFMEDARRTFAMTSEVIGRIGDTPLTVPTPCAKWDLRALLNHLINANRAISRFVATEPVSPDELAPDANSAVDFAGDDPKAAYDDAVTEALRIFAEPGALDRVLQGADGETPAMFMANVAVGDSLIHAWDIARASGQDFDLPEAVAAAALEAFGPTVPDGVKRGLFAPAVPVDPGASASDRFVALVGRDPNWRRA